MIIDSLANAERYFSLHPRFSAAFAFLRNTDLASLAQGRHAVDDEALFAIVSKSDGRRREEAKLECHRRYIDIQFIVSGSDQMGWKPVHDCTHPRGEYSDEKDILFFEDPTDTWVTTPSGCFCIFFPEDAHAPLVGAGSIHKIVLKIAV